MQYFINLAIQEAEKAESRGSVPIGAVVVQNNKVISSAGNEVIKNSDPTAHAEILAIRKACLLLNSHIIDECDIYVTLEPCAMCAHAIYLSRIRRLYFGAYDVKRGAVDQWSSTLDRSIYKTEVIGGVCETQCAEILQKFFEKKRI
ncbi:MAG: nucleoside deaminase [Holosporaceae bacterium]|jgi:tRNA(Arg) A34 adenosine deaminase TadA|nr:nucleoside deaminase [Holosporaceae bacterium]